MDLQFFSKGIRTLFVSPMTIYKYFFYSKRSYSQVGEDIILDFLFEKKKNGFYIDIGANHPRRLSNTLLFYKKGWRGINIEPNTILYKKFIKYRKEDINLNVGIGPNKGECLDFYVLQPDTLSTFDSNSAKIYESEGHKILEIKKVPIISLNELYENHIGSKEVDFISIDTEGYDMQVLESNDWNKNRPGFIILETLEYKKNGFGQKLNHIYDEYLFTKRYSKYADTYINTIYISDEYRKIFQL